MCIYVTEIELLDMYHIQECNAYTYVVCYIYVTFTVKKRDIFALYSIDL